MPDDMNLSAEFGSCCCSYKHLTTREIDVLCEAAAGRSNSQIAEKLNLSVHTVARHMTSMLHKAGEPSRTALVSRALRVGILAMGDHGPRATGRHCLH